MSHGPRLMLLGDLSEGDRFEFHGSCYLTGRVGETSPDGVIVFLDHSNSDGIRRVRPKVETCHPSMRVKKL